MASPDASRVDAVTRWSTLLDALATDAAHAAAGTAAPLAEWRPPADMPPLPGELVARARAVLAAQRIALAQATRARAELGRRLATVRAARPAPGRAPVYLDTLG